jgi:hypothetical protein
MHQLFQMNYKNIKALDNLEALYSSFIKNDAGIIEYPAGWKLTIF